MPADGRDRENDMEAESLTDVTMRLSQKAIDDANFIENRYGFPTKATAVAAALFLARLVAEHADRRRRIQLVIHGAGGAQYEVKVPWQA